MKLTYKQIVEALNQVYLQEFDAKKGKQPLAKYDCLSDVPMSEMVYLLHGVGDKNSVEIEQK